MVLLGGNVSATSNKNTLAQDKANQQVELNRKAIYDIIEELSRIRIQKIKGKTNVLSKDELLLEQKLESLGVRKLTWNEVKANHNIEDFGPYVSVPPSTNNVIWYELKHTVTRDGKSYDLQDLVAQGVGVNTNLYQFASGKLMAENLPYTQLNSLKTIASIYAQKMIGAALARVPIIGWAPWELLFEIDFSKATVHRYTIDYDILSTITYIYVKPSGKSDDFQKLSYVSNMAQVEAAHRFSGITNAGTTNARTFQVMEETSNVEYAQNYASGTKAIDSFLSPHAQKESFVKEIIFENHNQTKKFVVILPYLTLPTQVKS